MEVTRVKQSSYIQIAFLRGKNAMEYHSELVEALGNNALPYRTVARRKNPIVAKSWMLPAVIHSFEHHLGASTIFHVSTPILRENTLEGVRSSPLLTYHRPHERTCGLTASKNIPIPQRHYAFTHIHAFSWIRTLTQRQHSQRL
ncbi:hypothetical protein TNCV_2825341 [Trichonephila clavipes]|nr:hypothetical protein TNCV_2825341 [Trichonephila clavipes]